MRAWQRYMTAAVALVWFMGNLPAWLFLPTFTGTSGRQDSAAIFWTLAPVFAVAAVLIISVAWSGIHAFGAWVIGRHDDDVAERTRRIAALERELGIGQSERVVEPPVAANYFQSFSSGATMAAEVEMGEVIEIVDHTGRVIRRYRRNRADA